MTGFWVCWAIVLCIASLAAPWDDLLSGLSAAVRALGAMMVWTYEAVVVEAPTAIVAFFATRYRPRVYIHSGRHRRQPVDSEVDRWPGATDEYATLLHDLNSQHLLHRIAR